MADAVQEWVNKVYDIHESDVLLFVTSMGFDLSCYDIFGTLAAGGKSLVALSLQIAFLVQCGGVHNFPTALLL